MPRSFPVLLASALLIACSLSNPARSQTTSAPATTIPALNTVAKDPEAARAALGDFFRRMVDADPTAVDRLRFTDPQIEKAARVQVSLALAQQRVRLAASRVWGAGAADLAVGVSDKDRQQFENDLKVAAVNFKGDSAEIKTDHDGLFIVALKDGAWKLDFDKTQAGKGPLPKEADLPAVTAQTATLDQLAADLAEDAKTADIAKRHFKTVDDLKSRLQQLSSTPATSPK